MSARRFLMVVGMGASVAGVIPAQAGSPIVTFGVSPDGRRFMVNNKAAFLAGFREGYVGGDWDPVYWNQTSLPADHPVSPNAAQVDYDAYAHAILNAGMNMVRCTLIHMVAGSGRVHGANQYQDAYNYPPTAPFTQRPWPRTGGGQAWDGWQKHNLNEWNTWYWQRLAEWVQVANNHGIVVEVILFHQHNHYQLFTHYADNPLRPWNCNLATGLPNNYGERAYPEYYGDGAVLRSVQEAYVSKVLDTIGNYPGVIYRVACEYNWTDTWVEDWGARIKNWGAAHGKQLVVQVGGSMQQMKLMNADVHSMDGQYSFRQAGGSTCDPPSLVEVRLAGYCGGQGYDNDAPTVHTTLLWMWNDLPGKAVTRDSDAEVDPARKAWYAALTGGATAYCYHGYFYSGGSTPEAATGATTLANMLLTFQTMVPHDNFVVAGSGYVLATPGMEYLAYLPSGGSIQINLSAAAGTLRYDWYNPRTFTLSNGGTVPGGGTSSFTAPDTNDWALWIRGDLQPVAPVIAEVTPDPDSTYAGNQYVKQMVLLSGYPAPTWSVVAGPPGTQVDATGLVSGWTPGPGSSGTVVTFTIQASNSAGSDTESWQVRVDSVAPVIAEVTPDPDTATIRFQYVKQLTLLQGLPAPTWSVVTGPSGAQVNSSGLVNGWAPAAEQGGTLVDFTVQASNGEGSDTESWQVYVKHLADFDGDDDVDQEDFAHLQMCFTGSGAGYGQECQDADLMGDGDVDAEDFALFQSCMAGPNHPPGC